ncbi:conserved hypothetical protein [Bradyrhizobium sp. ORS 278]|uniref:hypothetical protein n=1 Tax=Bradyrhizobium sp. (strain ORS 278) TaxID=114615 RepID=UPI00015082B2|nr:hypothetical protein [Bradyrhizobium sp. ORS 278]CAL79411.1 conserved hypothetical protein [Bradyrhizobium sp. ORS 278]
MLPGFRFLVAAIVCSISLTIFGMGAAALLRAAHEQFASNSSWRSTQASGFTTFLPPAEPAPVLAVLRVEPSPTQPTLPVEPPPAAASPAEQPSAANVPTPVAETPEITPVAEAPALPTPSLPAETVDTSKAAIVANAVVTSDNGGDSVQSDRAASEAITTTVEKAVDKPKMDIAPDASGPAVSVASNDAAVVPVAPPPAQLVASADPTAASLPPSAAPAPVAAVLDPIAAKLAALAEQPAHPERPAASEHRASVKVASVQLRRSILKKRQAREKQLAARRAKQRRYAQRAKAARDAAAQQQQQQQQAFPDPFSQQFAQPAAIGQQAAGPRTR